MLGQYRIEEQLGAGGMGVVYRAHDTRLERTVALKLLRGDRVSGQRDHLLQEARAASALNHANIVAIHDIGSGGARGGHHPPRPEAEQRNGHRERAGEAA